MTRISVLLALAALFAGPIASASAAPNPRLRIAVSILPQVEFVERIGGDRVEVEALVLPGQSPATYVPTSRQMVRLSRAQVYFRIGVPFEEALLPRIEAVCPNLKVVDTRQGIRLRKMGVDAGAEKGVLHEEGDDHRHGDLDPHCWLDPRLVIVQCRIICDELIRLDPEGAAAYRQALEAYSADLKRLHERLTNTLKPLKGQTLLVFHPAFGYFADAYGLTQVAVEAGGKKPGPRRLAETIATVRQHGVKAVFVQAQFDQSSARAIAGAIGGKVVGLDPLARDYIRNMEAMANKIRSALSE